MFKLNENIEEFKREGYLKLPLLDEQEIGALKNLYTLTRNDAGIEGKKFYTSIWSNNIQYKETVDAGIKNILEPALARILNNFQSVFANFMVKLSGENSQLQPHQDWSFVDESKYDSITVWIPLSAVDKMNGALEVFPQSHKHNNFIRPRFQNSPFNDKISLIQDKFMLSIPMQVGEVLFVNSRTIHSSPPNNSSEDRIAVSIVIAPKEATLLHYVMEKNSQQEAYKLHVSSKFYTEYSCFDYPEIKENTALVHLEEKNFEF
jgi:hypothetical protein